MGNAQSSQFRYRDGSCKVPACRTVIIDRLTLTGGCSFPFIHSVQSDIATLSLSFTPVGIITAE